MTKKYHYVYKIINLFPITQEQYYIGVRSCNCKPEVDDYWGSSRYLNTAMKTEGKINFAKEILSIWGTRKKAAQEEIRLHNEYDVAANPLFYNRAKSTSTGWNTYGATLSEEARKNISDGHKLYWKTHSMSQEARKKISEAAHERYKDPKKRQEARDKNLGKSLSEETKKKISIAARNRPPISEETRKKISLSSSKRKHTSDTKKKISEWSNKRYPNYKIIEPNGTEHIIVDGLHKFAKSIGVCPSTIIKIANGHQPKFGKLFGWSCEVI